MRRGSDLSKSLSENACKKWRTAVATQSKESNFHAEEYISSSQPHYTRPDVVTCEIERTHFKLSVYM